MEQRADVSTCVITNLQNTLRSLSCYRWDHRGSEELRSLSSDPYTVSCRTGILTQFKMGSLIECKLLDLWEWSEINNVEGLPWWSSGSDSALPVHRTQVWFLVREQGGFQVVLEPACRCRRHKRHRFNPWVEKIPWRRHDNPLQYSCPENPMDKGAWWATVHRATKSQSWLKWLSPQACTEETRSLMPQTESLHTPTKEPICCNWDQAQLNK